MQTSDDFNIYEYLEDFKPVQNIFEIEHTFSDEIYWINNKRYSTDYWLYK